jgi:hypothetical protein
MQHVIKNTITQLFASLPKEHVYYSPSDFINAGFPDYLIQRIFLEVDRNLADSISLPATDWVDMRADTVEDAWDRFLSAIQAESRVPASYALSVIENAIQDMVDQFTQPRGYLLDTMIGESGATLDQLQSRKRWIVAYPILADALIRYLQRKEMEYITRDKALQVISHVDEKLAENYTPLKWAQHLDPIFVLLNHEVPSALFVRFFKDRGMTAFAKWIDQGPEFLSRTAFIERISTVGTLPYLETEDDESIAESAHKSETVTSSFSDPFRIIDAVKEEDTVSSLNEPSADKGPDPDETPPFKVDDTDEAPVDESDTGQDHVAEVVTLDDVLAEEGNAVQPLFARFQSLDEEELVVEAAESKTSPIANFDAEPALSVAEPTESPADGDSPGVWTIAEVFRVDANEPALGDQLSEETEVVQPLAQMEDEEMDEPEETPPIIDASSDDEHIIYLTDRAKRLLDLLEPQFESYVVDIFLNDELDFYKHLENIVAYDQWRSAGRYITRDIFDRNRIDLYSETAVMFTDAVQEFFDQNA